jgi:hypothetical protein
MKDYYIAIALVIVATLLSLMAGLTAGAYYERLRIGEACMDHHALLPYLEVKEKCSGMTKVESK